MVVRQHIHRGRHQTFGALNRGLPDSNRAIPVARAIVAKAQRMLRTELFQLVVRYVALAQQAGLLRSTLSGFAFFLRTQCRSQRVVRIPIARLASSAEVGSTSFKPSVSNSAARTGLDIDRYIFPNSTWVKRRNSGCVDSWDSTR